MNQAAKLTSVGSLIGPRKWLLHGENSENRVFARTKDWIACWQAPGQPGKFQIAVDKTPLGETFGESGITITTALVQVGFVWWELGCSEERCSIASGKAGKEEIERD